VHLNNNVHRDVKNVHENQYTKLVVMYIFAASVYVIDIRVYVIVNPVYVCL
jgi:hypothetical protein